MRCLQCTKFTPNTLKVNGPDLPFHTFSELEDAARQGCEVCAILIWNTFGIHSEQRDSETYDRYRDCKEQLLVRWSGVDQSTDQRGYGCLSVSLPTSYDVTASHVAHAIVEDNAEVSLLERTCLSKTELMKLWLGECELSHRKCCHINNASGKLHGKPARLIDLSFAEDANQIRLVESSSKTTRYATLSYRWDQAVKAAMTTQTNVDERFYGFSMKRLPQLYGEVFDICRALEIRYVWIDAICIIQPTKEHAEESDWQSQSAIMGDIYSASVLTICAGSDRIGSSESTLYPSKALLDVDVRCSPLFANLDNSVYVRPEATKHTLAVKSSPLRTRGWVLQERLLSRRVLHFTSYGVYWRCQEKRASEQDRCGLFARNEDHWKFPQPSLPGMLLRPTTHPTLGMTQRLSIIPAWKELLLGYGKCRLTYPTDRLPAISALTRLLALASGDTYLAGLWRSDILRQLRWHGEPHKGNQRSRPPAQVYVAPSWSWASVIGPLDHAVGVPVKKPGSMCADFLGADVRPVFAGNPFGQVQPGSCVTISTHIRHRVSIKGAQRQWNNMQTHVMNDITGYGILTHQRAATSEVASRNSNLGSDGGGRRHLFTHSTVVFDTPSDAQEMQNPYSEFSFALIHHDLEGRASTSDSDVGLEDRPAFKKYIRHNPKAVLFEGLALVPLRNSADSQDTSGTIKYRRIGWIKFYDNGNHSAEWFEGAEREVIEMV